MYRWLLHAASRSRPGDGAWDGRAPAGLRDRLDDWVVPLKVAKGVPSQGKQVSFSSLFVSNETMDIN